MATVINSVLELVQILDKTREDRGITHNELMMDSGLGSRPLLSILSGRSKDLKIGQVLALLPKLGYDLALLPRRPAKQRRLDAVRAKAAAAKAVAKAAAEQPETVAWTADSPPDGDMEVKTIQVPADLHDRVVAFLNDPSTGVRRERPRRRVNLPEGHPLADQAAA